MRVSVLASGSTGNTSLIETKDHKVLMDAGLSGKKIACLLEEVGVKITDIDLVFLSHDHADHSSGLGVLLRRYPQIKAFANRGTWNYLINSNKIGKLPVGQLKLIDPGQTITLGDLTITAFATSHDAAQPQYYLFSNGGKKIAFLTDTGYVSENVCQVIKGADAYMMEFNYDTMMLRNGPYSWPLKERILSDVGHLSNEAASQALCKLVCAKTKYIFLAHRSQANNTKLLAYQVAQENLLAGNGEIASDLSLISTSATKPTKLIQI